MADNSKRVSELPTAANVASADRILVLRDPASNPSVRTVNVSIFIANVSTVVAANIMSSNIVPAVANTITPYVVAEVTPIVVANVVPIVIANVTPTVTNNVIEYFSNNLANNIFLAIRNETPANTSANGDSGEITYDTDYIYVCVANNTWKRATLSTW